MFTRQLFGSIPYSHPALVFRAWYFVNCVVTIRKHFFIVPKRRLPPQQVHSQCLFYSKLVQEGLQWVSGQRMTISLLEQAGIWWRTNGCLDFSLQNPSCACFGSWLSPCFAATAPRDPAADREPRTTLPPPCGLTTIKSQRLKPGAILLSQA